jgi:hypothetical protein
MAFVSDEFVDDARERYSGFVLEIGLRETFDTCGIELVLCCVVVGVGVGLVFDVDSTPDCAAM